MSDTAMAELLVLAIIVLGFAMIFGGGHVEPRRIIYALAWIVFAPTISFCAARYALAIYQGLPFTEQLLVITLTPFIILLLIRAFFPKATWLQRVGEVLSELLIFTLTFPIRILWRSVRLIVSREHHVRHLSDAQPVVGHPPPTEVSRREDKGE